MNYLGAIFDLDGVLVDTAKYHYLAWKQLADELGIDFTPAHNERLKGISRMESLETLLSIGGMEAKFSAAHLERMAADKNQRYVDFISKMTKEELLPGARELLQKLKSQGVKTALGSASKNAPMILENTGLKEYFDAIVDGNLTTTSKPDPEVFLLGAEMLGLPPKRCAVFEDSQAGLQAAKSADMLAVGIGDRAHLTNADVVFDDLLGFPLEQYFS